MKKFISAVMIIIVGAYCNTPLHAAPGDALRQREISEDPARAGAVGAMLGASANATASAQEKADELMAWAKLQIGQGTSETEIGRLLAERVLAEPEHAVACRRVAEGLGGDALAVFEREILRFEKRFLTIGMLRHETSNLLINGMMFYLYKLKDEVPINYHNRIEEILQMCEQKQLTAEYEALEAKQGGKLGRMQVCEYYEKNISSYKHISQKALAFLDEIPAYKQLAFCQALEKSVSFILLLLGAFDDENGIVLEHKKQVEPKIVLEMIDKYYGNKAKRKGYNFEVLIPEDCPQILSSELAVWLIISNLVRNGTQAMDEAGHASRRRKTLSLITEIKPDPYDPGKVIIRVKDEGVGIPNGIKDKIFEPFFTAARPSSLMVLHGLGLAIVKEIVQSHGGTIDVESRHISEYPDSHGTTFTVKLPAAAAALAGLPIALEQPAPLKAQAILAEEI